MTSCSDYVLYYRSCRGGLRRCLRLPGWAPLAALAVVVAGSMHLAFNFQEILDHNRLRVEVADVRVERDQERRQLLTMQDRLAGLQHDVAPVAKLNGKLALLTNLGGGSDGLSPMGSPAPAESSYGGEKRLSRQLAAMALALLEEIAYQETRQRQLASLLRERALEFAARPSIWPTRGQLNSPFGNRFMGRSREFHKGVDIGVPVGTSVLAPADGKVVSVAYEHGYGLTVQVEHRNGLTTLYAHLRAAEVEEGETVNRGTRIALSGMSGRTTGSHLHYEVRLHGNPVDPMDYLLD